ncbi:hypothetical protein D3C84_1308660 [compost metagenome]
MQAGQPAIDYIGKLFEGFVAVQATHLGREPDDIVRVGWIACDHIDVPECVLNAFAGDIEAG